MNSARLGCSTISFRRQSLADELMSIRDAGFDGIDLGALPGACDYDVDDEYRSQVAAIARHRTELLQTS